MIRCSERLRRCGEGGFLRYSGRIVGGKLKEGDGQGSVRGQCANRAVFIPFYLLSLELGILGHWLLDNLYRSVFQK